MRFATVSLPRETGTTRRAAAAPAPEIVEEVDGGGVTLDEGIIYTSTVFLLGACVLAFLAYQRYKAGG